MAANERLRAALLQQGHTLESLAAAVGVDPKTVERWIGGRTPYRRTRYELAMRLKTDEAYLWPGSYSPAQLASASEAEVIAVHSNRAAVPHEAWSRMFDAAEEEIGILVYSGYFLLADDPRTVGLIRSKAEAGVRVRILIGDPDSEVLRARGSDEGIDEGLASRVRNVITVNKALLEVDGIELRLHETTLYNSIFFGDDELLVNTHVYGLGAAYAPVLHLRQVAGGSIVSTYLNSFEKVWASARPLTAGA
jgi:transcriptional regulator with XRE-family HTH domain